MSTQSVFKREEGRPIFQRLTGVLGALVVMALLAMPLAAQQTGNVTGVVTDARTGDPVVGAQVQLTELNRGTLTNVSGRYLMQQVPVGTHTVRVIYLGYATAVDTIDVTSGENRADFTLETEAIQLDALVVTGQQIERQAREVAYSVSTVDGDKLSEVRETNFVEALQGQAPGVQIIQQSGNVGGSSRIVIRGVTSLSGDNQPLFVVDGVPISNSNVVPEEIVDGNARLSGGAIDVGNRAADLSSDDIETVTVLRGAAAAALYGQRAKNGVILIQTRKGRSIGGMNVTASTTIRRSSPLVLPDFQNTFAQGDLGAYDPQDLDGWGPRIAGQEVENIRGETITLRAHPDNVKDFYDDALLIINSASVSAADERADFRLGLTHQDQDGVVPTSNLQRTSINLNSGYQARDDLSARLSGFYTRTESIGRVVQGGNDPNVLTSLINTLPRTMGIDELREFKDEFGNQVTLGPQTNNPFWIINENPFGNEVDRLFGSATVEYSPLEWLSFTGRAGADLYTEDRTREIAIGTLGRDDGGFNAEIIQESQYDFDLQGQAQRDVHEDVNVRAVAGFNLNDRQLELQRTEAVGLQVPGLLNFANASSTSPINQFQHRKVYGVYGDVTVGYRDYLFLNLTGRNDWSSTLPEENRSFFYPSVNVSFIPTEAFDIAGDVLSYMKVRANYAQVGSDEDPYQLDFRFFPVSDVFGQFGATLTFPFGEQTAFEATNTIPPANLKPQNQISMELGGELQLFNGRAGIDFTYYDVRTEDQIISIPIPESTGFAANRTNIGEVSNEGVELQVNVNPLRTQDFTWDVIANFTQNENTVVSLAPGVEEIIIQSGFNSLQVKAEPGESFGLYGPGFLRVTDESSPHFGEILIDETTGLREEGDIRRLGSIDPDFQLGVSSSLTWRNVTLSGLVDWREGGVIFSNTVGLLRRSGLAEETAVNRDGTFIDEGVVQNPDGTFRPNDVPVSNMQQFWQRYANAGIHEGNIFDASNARLREVRLDWSVPRGWLEQTPFGRLSIGVEGRNLWLFYKKVPHIDPEVGLFGSASDGQGVEWNVLPSTRSFGLTIQAGF